MSDHLLIYKLYYAKYELPVSRGTIKHNPQERFQILRLKFTFAELSFIIIFTFVISDQVEN